jgi:hypothetical protein
MRSVLDRLVALGISAAVLGLYRMTLAPSLVHPPATATS